MFEDIHVCKNCKYAKRGYCIAEASKSDIDNVTGRITYNTCRTMRDHITAETQCPYYKPTLLYRIDSFLRGLKCR